MTDQPTSSQTDALFTAILSLETLDDCRAFFRDLCTLSELDAMTERLEVARLVQQNVPYRTISQQTGSSTATITRVAHWLHHGMGGYARVLGQSA